ncbi:MOSC domain-containing protein [Thiosulfativibrio zosterae]|uniref:Sulfurase n=1 Tax=Thiosulfativibrio zosterae TaxID=2675053 RepID=A0A6F8PQ81_9GAMM|nr:MOSC domain-containing protein [Thiosulfativibrio zosterae]BBP44281.1 sulfurase [Thiosulfativibrio zosterae]
MKVLSLNIGQARTYDWRGETASAIHKQSVATAELTETGFVGDTQCDLKNHGGLDKAVMVLPAQNYALFNVQDPFGYLGENITLEGLDETQVCVGDRLQIGEVILEVSQPRSPCWKLDALTGRKDLLKIYAESGRVGFYCRVIQTGVIQQNDEIIHFPNQKQSCLVISELFLAKYHSKSGRDIQLLNQAIQHPALSTAWREELQKILTRLQRSCDYLG